MRCLKTEGKNGHVHRDSAVLAIWIDDDDTKVGHGYAVTLDRYRNAWHLLDDEPRKIDHGQD
jgi:hypothetical protein